MINPILPCHCRLSCWAGGLLVYLSALVQNDGLGCTALSGASCFRQTDTAGVWQAS